MAESDSGGRCPQDLVAIFHASFHPTKGNIVDWSLKASDDLNLDGLEYSVLPSGLHLVEQDVVYFTKDGQHGVCVFRRRPTAEPGHRGFRLSSLGILLARSARPRPQRHVRALKELAKSVYARMEREGVMEPTEEDWDPARAFWEERRLRRADLGGAGDWAGWSEELDGIYSEPSESNPTLHLPHLLRILGPSSLTLYKHILGRKRVLIYTLPPVEVACILCHVAGDLCFESQVDDSANSGHLRGKHREPVNVLGMVTLTDLDRLEVESRTGRGWVACTTDAIFMEKPSYYDLLIDLTTSTPSKATRPTFYASKPVPPQPGSLRGPSHKLSSMHFAWSDVKLWNEVDRILRLDSDSFSPSHHTCCLPSPSSTAPAKSKSITLWTDAWQVYEDVCIICAGLWMGSWRGNSPLSYSTAHGAENWGSVRLEGDDDLTREGVGKAYVRNVGMGIEGRPVGEAVGAGLGVPGASVVGAAGAGTSKAGRRVSAMSWSSGRATVVGTIANGKGKQVPSSSEPQGNEAENGNESSETYGLEQYHSAEEEAQRRNAQVLTTMAVLQTFHAHTLFQLSVLKDLLVRQGLAGEGNGSGEGEGEGEGEGGGRERVVLLSPKDMMAFELSPLSSFDARYLEWLVEEYGGEGVRVTIKRSWKDLLVAVFGYG